MLVPKLRFKEFDGDWESDILLDISDVTKLAGFEFTEYVTYSDKGKIIALRGLNIKNGKLILNDVKYIDNSNFSKLNRSKLYKGDILFTYVGTVGQVALVDIDDKYFLAPNVSRIRFIKKVSSFFAKQYMGDIKFYKKQVLPLIATSSQPALSMENIRTFKLNFPSLIEQTKIAKFLSLVDKKIELQSQKVEALKLYKKGLTNKVFNSIDGQHKKLADLLTKWNLKNKNNALQYVESVSNKYGFIPQSEQFEDRIIASIDKKNYYIIKKNVFAYNPSRLDVGSLALKTDSKMSLVSPLYECFTTNENSLYMLEWFNSNKFKRATKAKFEGGVRNTLTFKNLSTIEIIIPNKDIQTMYATIFTHFNQKITNEEKKLNYLHKFKKGLLQQMFV